MNAFSALADELEGRKAPPAAARGTGSFSEFNVSPEQQAGRDDERVKILRAELAQEPPDSKYRRDIQMEIDRTAGGTAYGKPAKGAPVAAARAAATNPFTALADELEGSGAPAGRPKTQVAAAPTAGEAPPEAQGPVGRAFDAVKAAVPTTLGGLVENAMPVKPVAEFVANQATGLGSAIMGGWRGLSALASGAGLDEAVRQVHAPELAGGGRAEVYQPETKAGQAASAVAALPGEAIGYVGKKAGQATMEATGSPAAATAVETAAQAAPLVLGLRGGSRVIAAEPKVVGSGSIAEQPRAAAPAAIEDPVSNLDIPTYLRRKQGEPLASSVERAQPKQPLTLAAQEPAPPKGPSVFDRVDSTPEQTAAAAVAEAPKFVETATASDGAALPKAEQASRQKVLEAVGVKETRKSAIEGDPAKARTEWDTARMEGTQEGALAKRVLDSERDALTKHAESIVDETGGTRGTDTSALYTRGDTILRPIHELKNWFDGQIKTLYGEADKAAGGIQTTLGKTTEALGKNSDFVGTTEGQALQQGIKSYLKESGMVDDAGNMKPVTAQQAERLRQYLGDQWKPGTSRLIGRLKDIIDDDVFSAAGGEVYQKARAMRAMRSRVFENDVLDPAGRTIPNGVGKIVDASANKGIELLKATEQVPDAIARLPVDQLAQVVKTLKSVPPEVQPQAAAALAEIKGQFANRILEAGSKTEGQWGAPGVTKYLNANAAKLRLLFDDAELAKISNLNEAGHILRIGPYPGAAVQSSNLMKSGVAKGAELVGAGTGALVGTIVGGPVGTAVGTAVGQAAGKAAAGKMQARSAMKDFENRFTRLGDIGKGAK